MMTKRSNGYGAQNRQKLLNTRYAPNGINTVVCFANTMDFQYIHRRAIQTKEHMIHTDVAYSDR
jgi:hypothetical protein